MLNKVSYTQLRDRLQLLYGKIVSTLSAADFDEISISDEKFQELEDMRVFVKDYLTNLKDVTNKFVNVADSEEFTISKFENIVEDLGRGLW